MQGIDYSNWKADLDPTKVPHDFAFVQTTWGAGEVTNNGIVGGVWQGADAKIQAEKASGKPWGFVHYIRGVGAEKEAQFFYEHNRNYFHDGIPAIDWEQEDNSSYHNAGYLDTFLFELDNLTDVPPIIYCSGHDYSRIINIADKHNCGIWVASYANMDTTGYQESPWSEGSWPEAILRQYSSNGRLEGYSGALDLDKFYGDAETLWKYAKKDGHTQPEPSTPLNPPTPPTPQTYTVQPGDTLSGIAYRYGVPMNAITGYKSGDPNKIQAGEILSIGGATPVNPETLYTIQPGDTLSGIASKFGTTWEHLQDINGISNPDYIRAGDTIVVH